MMSDRPIILVSVCLRDRWGHWSRAFARPPVLGVQWEVQEGWEHDAGQRGLFEAVVMQGRGRCSMRDVA